MKPILFKTEMVRATLEGRKTATRRVVKLKYSNTHLEMFTNKYGTRLIEKQNEEPGVTTIRNPDGTTTHKILACIEKEPPYRPGDILYVRETFKIDYLSNIPGSGRIHYKADDTYSDFTFAPERYEMMRRAQLKPGWRPNENMPREAARIFLRLTGVKVQRVQDITDEEARKEGCKGREDFHRVWNDCYAKPRPVKIDGVIDHYESYPWEDIQGTRTYRGRHWYVIGNPWVWVIGFERCEKPEGDEHGLQRNH